MLCPTSTPWTMHIESTDRQRVQSQGPTNTSATPRTPTPGCASPLAAAAGCHAHLIEDCGYVQMWRPAVRAPHQPHSPPPLPPCHKSTRVHWRALVLPHVCAQPVGAPGVASSHLGGLHGHHRLHPHLLRPLPLLVLRGLGVLALPGGAVVEVGHQEAGVLRRGGVMRERACEWLPTWVPT